MHRYSPVRNQRPKRIKIKHVLRICFLIALCCWLIFQIKRSHYKKKALDSFDTKIISRVDEMKLGRKDLLQPKETDMHKEEEEDDEDDDDEGHEIEEEKDDEIDGNEEEDGQIQTVNEAREEHYKADDASSAVTDNQVHNGAMIQETGFESVNMSSDHSQYDSDPTRVIEESETSLKLTNMSAVVEPQSVAETEDPDEVQHDAIDATDFIRLEDLDAIDNGEDTVVE